MDRSDQNAHYRAPEILSICLVWQDQLKEHYLSKFSFSQNICNGLKNPKKLPVTLTFFVVTLPSHGKFKYIYSNFHENIVQ